MRCSHTRAFLVYVGANTCRLRTLKGLTQEELAEASNIETRYVQMVERGRVNLSLDVLVAIATALNVIPSALLRPAKLALPKRGRPTVKLRHLK